MSDPSDENHDASASKSASRPSAHKSAKQSELERLKSARAKSGVNRAEVQALDDLYETLSPEEYQKRKVQGGRMHDFVEDDTGDYVGDDDDLVDEEERAPTKKGGKKASAATKAKKSAASLAAAERKRKKAEAENPNKARVDFSSGGSSGAVKKNTIAESFLKATHSSKKRKQTDDDLDDLLSGNLLEEDEDDDNDNTLHSKSSTSGLTKFGEDDATARTSSRAKAKASSSTSPSRGGGGGASSSAAGSKSKSKSPKSSKKSGSVAVKMEESADAEMLSSLPSGADESPPVDASSSSHMMDISVAEPTEEELAEMEMAMAIEKSIHEDDKASVGKTGKKYSNSKTSAQSGKDGKSDKAAKKYAPLDVSIMTDDSVLIEDDDDEHEYLGSDWGKIASKMMMSGGDASIGALKKRGAVVADFSPLLDANGHLLMYWLDAYEDVYHRPGTVFLFGYVWNEKEANFQSMCVSVENMQRTLHFYPRVGSSTEDVRKEVDEVRKELGIKTFLSKAVEKRYAFEVDAVPRGVHTFLEVLYPFADPVFSAQRVSGETYAHVFGTTRTALETLLLESKLMGPGWVVIKSPIHPKAPTTWCSYECKIGDPDNLVVARFPSSGSKVDVASSKMDVAAAAANASGVVGSATGSVGGVIANTGFEMPPTPKLRVLSLKLQVLYDHQTKQNEILGVAGFEKWRYDVERATEISELERGEDCRVWCILRKVPGVDQAVGLDAMLKNHTRLSMENSEKALLNHLMQKIGELDPDVIVGHGLTSFDLDLLLHRLHHHKITMWSKLGRLHKNSMPKMRSGAEANEISLYTMREASAGRLLCDTYTAATEFLRSQKNYKLTTLASVHLDVKRREILQSSIIDMLTQTKTIEDLAGHMLNDAYIMLQLVAKLDVLPLTRQLTELGGNLWSRSLTGARAERIEYLLMHKFYDSFVTVKKEGDGEIVSSTHSIGYILPDKVKNDSHQASQTSGEGNAVPASKKKSKNAPAYKGGLVLAPQAGLYEQFTLLLDFNSLYPSLIQEYNVCFTTIERRRGENGDWLPSDPPDSSVSRGVLPTTIRELVDKRKQVKKMLASETDATKKKQLDVRQLAIKLVANSMYGCLGFRNSRFFAMPLAELITRKGREALTKAKEIAGNMNMEVIYGDTDSIMINTKTNEYAEVRQMGVELKKKINKSFSELEIDIDGIFKSLLLLQKKKYAAMVCGAVRKDGTVEVTRQEKGLDLVRRDWCNLASQLGRDILSCIFDETHQREKDGIEVLEGVQDLLRKRAEDVRSGSIRLDDYVITKSMTKRPEDYPDAHSQPHVQVALAMRKEGKHVMVGEMIPYVICVVPSSSSNAQQQQQQHNTSLASRARHPDTVKRDSLQIDFTWYLTHQVHPSAARLCEHIQGLDAMAIADLLGLDANAFKRVHASSSSSSSSFDVNMPSSSQQSIETRFKECERWKLPCRKCGVPFVFEGVLLKMAPSLSTESIVDEFYKGCKCANDTCQSLQDDNYLKNSLTLLLRRIQTCQYDAAFVCTGCGKRTRQPVFRGRASNKVICTCSQADEMVLDTNPRELYTQLLYLQSIFDVYGAMKRAGFEEGSERYRAIVKAPFFSVLQDLYIAAKHALQQNRYAIMECSNLFSMFADLPPLAAPTTSAAAASRKNEISIPQAGYDEEDDD